MGHSGALFRLERAIDRIEARPRHQGPVVPTGIPPLDMALPEGGLPRGRVIEWLGPRSSGKTTLLRITLARLRAAGGSVALIDAGRTLYAPDWLKLVNGEGLFWVIRPEIEREAVWCADLVLRSGAFDAVVLQVPGTGENERSGLEPDARGASLHRGVTVRLQRLAEEANAVFVAIGRTPLAALRLSFRPGRIEPVRDLSFGPFLPLLRPVWVRVGKRGDVEVPLLCPLAADRRTVSAPDRKGPH